MENIYKTSVAGFTLVELLVSLSIITVIMTVVLFNYKTFSDNLSLASAGQEVVIAIRQAQTYGLNVKEVTVSGGVFTSAYGVYFDSAYDTTHYYLFTDTNGNMIYDGGNGCGSGNTECVKQETLRNGVKISNICDATTCPPVATARRANITFLRPNPDALVYFTNIASSTVAGPSSTGKIVLTSLKNKNLTVIVESTGQILVQ